MKPQMPSILRRPRRPVQALLALAISALFSAHAADIDIYGAKGSGAEPNVVFLLDNTSNWSSNNQGWNSGDSWTRCAGLSATAQTECKAIIEAIYYDGISAAAQKRPWQAGFDKKDSVDLTQGQVQLRAMKLVLNSMVCSGAPNPLKLNVGIAMLSDEGTVLSNGHSSGFIRFAVRPLVGTAGTAGSSCKLLIDDLSLMDSKINDPTFKAPSSANYSAAMFEIFKYFGGHANPTGASQSPLAAGTPVGATGYGPVRFSKVNSLDDPLAFVDAGRNTYKSPINSAATCGGSNYIVLVGNTYPNAEPNNGGPIIFSGIGYTPPALSLITSDTSRFADEWAQFLANTDVNSAPDIQRIFTFAVNTYKDKPDPDQTKLLKSMAAVGGVGAAGYLEVGGDLVALVNGFEAIFSNIAAVNSVFAAATLPVSTTTQGTFLNQVFVGSFRPDAAGKPRWVGNLKQYQFGRSALGELDLFDSANSSAVLPGNGNFAPTAKSFWTEPSVYFTNQPSGTPLSASDSADGAVVEKGGAAQMLRKVNLLNSATRRVYTQPSVGSALSTAPFSTGNAALLLQFSASQINWVRGENNVTTGPGAEDFSGSYMNGATLTTLGSTGARHSIHGDVLHSRPVALNYGNGDVVVYYGSNDGFVRAVDGRQTGATAGHELWSFIAPEHYPLLKRHHAGTPELFLPETTSTGSMNTPAADTAAKSYGMDGPIGVFVAYNGSGPSASVQKAHIYPSMRRGGRVVYALDVTDRASPKLMWKITGGSGDFAGLAQTWSMPKPVIFPPTHEVYKDPIIIMGGGYDPAEDSNGSTGIGNRIFVINGRTGAMLKELTTDFSVPSDVAVVDTNADGRPDRGYVSDVRGNLYRISFTDSSGTLLAPDAWTLLKIAALGGKVFHAPDVIVTNSFVGVLAGTGDREKPMMVSTADHFVMIKDKLIGQTERAEPLLLTNLARVARVVNSTDQSFSLADVNVNPASPNGCYLQLATNGEKVVNAPFTIAGVTYFGTNRPQTAAAGSCTANLGVARSYKFPLFCGLPSQSLIEGGGFPPSPVGGLVTINVNGRDVLTPFLIGSGKSGSSFKPDEPTPSVPPVRTRQNWRLDNSNR